MGGVTDKQTHRQTDTHRHINTMTFPGQVKTLYWFYYLHRLRDLVSPVRGLLFNSYLGPGSWSSTTLNDDHSGLQDLVLLLDL